VAIIALLAATAVPIYRNAMTRARLLALAADLTELHESMLRYHADHGGFPADTGAGALDTRTLDPLASGGYFASAASLNRKLKEGRILLYWAPDWSGRNSEFIAVARPADDPSTWVYVMHYAFGGLVSYDGVYVIEDGDLVRWNGKF